MKKIILLILGSGILALSVYAFSPLLYDKKVSENISQISPGQVALNMSDSSLSNARVDAIETVSTGTFQGIGVHSGKGEAKILKNGDTHFVRLDDNFEVTNGPDLYVYLGRNGQYDPQAEVARLKGNVGGQNHEIPAGIEESRYNEVWI